MKIAVLSTSKYDKKTINGVEYNNYPRPDISEWVDAKIIDNPHLNVYTADFDGDVMGGYPVFTKECNEEAERVMYKKSNLLYDTGKPKRVLINEGILSLYELTKNKKKG